MKKISAIFLGLVLAGSVFAQSTAPTFTSETGVFSASFRLKPDSKVETSASDGVDSGKNPARTYTFTAEADEGNDTLMYTDYTSVVEGPDLTPLVQAMFAGLKVEIADTQSVTVQGHSGVRASGSLDGLNYDLETFAAGSRLFTLFVVADTPAGVDSEAKRFFESFKLLK